MATFPKNTNINPPAALEQVGIPATGPKISLPASVPGYIPRPGPEKVGNHGTELEGNPGEHAQWYEQGLSENGGGPYVGTTFKNPPMKYTPKGAGDQDAR